MHSTRDVNHGLASVVKALLWSKMDPPPLPAFPPLPYDLYDDDHPASALSSLRHRPVAVTGPELRPGVQIQAQGRGPPSSCCLPETSQSDPTQHPQQGVEKQQWKGDLQTFSAS